MAQTAAASEAFQKSPRGMEAGPKAAADQAQAPPTKPTLQSVLMRRVAAAPIAVCLLGLCALALTYWRVYDANSTLVTQWTRVRDATQAAQSSSTAPLSSASLVALQALANATLLHASAIVAQAGAADPMLDASYFRVVVDAMVATSGPSAAQTSAVSSLAKTAVARLLASYGDSVGVSGSLPSVSWCVAAIKTAGTAQVHCLITSFLGVAASNAPFSLVGATVDTPRATITGSMTASYAGSGATVLPTYSSTISASVAQLVLATAVRVLAFTTEAFAFDLAAGIARRNATGVDSTSGAVFATTRVTSTAASMVLVRNAVALAFTVPCDTATTASAAACGSTVTLTDGSSGTGAAVVVDAFTGRGKALVYGSADHLPDVAAAMIRATSLPATFSVTPTTLGTSVPLFYCGLTVAGVRVGASFDRSEALLSTVRYASAAADVASRSLLASHITFAVGALLLLAVIPLTIRHVRRVASAVAAPLTQLASDFAAASQMKLQSVTAYRRTDPLETAPPLPPAAMAIPQMRLDSAESRTTATATTLGSPAVANNTMAPRPLGGLPSPPTSAEQQNRGGDIGHPNSLSPLHAAQAQHVFSEFSVIADVQLRCNQMALALHHCSAFIPRSVFMMGSARLGTAFSGPPPPDTPVPDVAQVFSMPAAMTTSAPPKLQIMVSSHATDDDPLNSRGSTNNSTSKASPVGDAHPATLEAFRFGLSTVDAVPTVLSPTGDDLELSTSAQSPMGFGLRRAWASIMHVSFSGFLKMVGDITLHETHCVSQIFLSVVVGIVDRHSGVVLCVSADRVTATWGAFSTLNHHENRAAACAFDVRRALGEAEREHYLPELMWCAVVTAGHVVVGTSGTETDRSPTVHGPCLDVASELPPLLVALNVQVAVTDSVNSRLMGFRDRETPWHTLPIDRVTMPFGNAEMTIYELRTGIAPSYTATYIRGFNALMGDEWTVARSTFAEVLEQCDAGDEYGMTEPDFQAERLHQISVLFESLGVSYIRALPAWQRFEFDSLEDDASAPNNRPRERRTLAEKRKSVMPDDILRTELINMHNMRAAKQASPKASSMRLAVDLHSSPPTAAQRRSSLVAPNGGSRRGSAVGGASNRRVSLVIPEQGSPTAKQPPVPLGPSMLGASGSGEALRAQRRPSRKPFSEQATFSLSIAAATPPTQSIPPPHLPSPGATDISPMSRHLRPGVYEFRDRKGMLFRVSGHVLGRGAAGEVLLGISETGCLVAVKTVNIPRQTQTAEALTPIQRRRLKRKGINISQDVMADVENLLQEVAVLSRLREDHIVGYLSSAIVTNGTQLAVVMEFISGGSLLSLLQEFDGMPLRTVKRYLRDILMGLKFLHKEGIIHRDLKPHNVLLLIDGRCKLTDFGTSSSIDKIAGATDTAGTPQYMSPEACRGETLTPASDMWSFGILMAQLLTSELPWDMEHFVPIAFVYQVGHNEDKIPHLRDGSSLPEAALEIIFRCCQRDPKLRPSAEDLLGDPFFQSTTTPIRSSGRAASRASSRSRRSVAGSDRGPSPFATARREQQQSRSSTTAEFADEVQSPPAPMHRRTSSTGGATADEPASPEIVVIGETHAYDDDEMEHHDVDGEEQQHHIIGEDEDGDHHTPVCFVEIEGSPSVGAAASPSAAVSPAAASRRSMSPAPLLPPPASPKANLHTTTSDGVEGGM